MIPTQGLMGFLSAQKRLTTGSTSLTASFQFLLLPPNIGLEENSVSNDILKLPCSGLLEPPDKPFKLFDMRKFQQNVNRELKRAYPDRRKLEAQCISGLDTTSFFSVSFFLKKSMTPRRGNNIFSTSSSLQLPRLRLGPLKGFLS